MAGVFLIRGDEELIELAEKEYVSEDRLQKLLAKYPALLSGDQLDPERPRRWLLISREMGLPSSEGEGDRWAVDHLFLDQDGIPTLVEVKRSSDTRIRREVIGQLLEYAANATVQWPVETIEGRFRETCSSDERDPDEVLDEFLGEETSPGEFWQQVKTNLQAGRLRLIIVADEIPPELRRIVEFLNEQMDPTDVFAIEIKQFVSEGLRTLVPQVLGQSEKKRSSRRESRQWDKDSFFDELRRRKGDEVCRVADSILRWFEGHGFTIRWGTGKRTGYMIPTFQYRNRDYGFAYLTTRGSIELQFGQLTTRPPFDQKEKRREFLKRLNTVEGLDIQDSMMDAFPRIFMDVLSKEDRLNRFLEVLEWATNEVQKEA
jgi:hypothetical protein